VLAFDYWGIGENGGQPRRVLRIREQLADWQAAITLARLAGSRPGQAGVPELFGFRRPGLSGGGTRPAAGRHRADTHSRLLAAARNAAL
jgi:ribosomal protein L18